ncbi:MAG: phage tail spike protein [Clostridia bacterium]
MVPTGEVYIYPENAQDFESTGLVGALCPIRCEHEEIAGGMSAVTLTHPFDAAGRWKAIARGCVLKCDTRVRTTPEIAGGQVVTAVEVWSVKATASKAERYVYTQAKKGRKRKLLPLGTEVVVVQKGAERYKVKLGRTSGWIAHAALEFKLAQTLDASTDAIEGLAPPWTVRSQLFRILDVDVSTKSGAVTAYAPHISYDLNFGNTRYKNDAPLDANTALNGILDGCDFAGEFEFFTDIADKRTSCDWVDISPLQALLDPEIGFLTRWGAELVRDDFELYLLRRAGRNRGARIEYGKNLLGVDMKSSDEKVVTAILPMGEKKDGSPLYLTDTPDNPDNYVYSEYADSYPVRRVHVLGCQACKVSKDIPVALARARMREQAGRMFSEDQADLPEVSLTVNYLELGSTEEYRQYAQLETVYLYDEVPVVDRRHGIEISATVRRLVFDCLLERVVEIELGNIQTGLDTVYSWQIPALSGQKLLPGTVPGGALEDGAIPPAKLDPDLQEALNQAWADIEAAQQLLTDTRTWLDTLETTTETLQSAVTDHAGSITALRQTATEIRAGLTDAQNNLATVQLTAGRLQTAMESAQGDISTLSQTASGLSSTVSNLSGSITSIRQDVNGISQTVNGTGGLASQIQQLSDRVAIRLYNPAISSAFEAAVGIPAMGGSYAGLEFRRPGSDSPYGAIGLMNAGGLFDEGLNIYGRLDLKMSARSKLWLSAGGNNSADLILKYDERKAAMSAVMVGHFLPDAGDSYDLGGDGNGMRWRKLFTNTAVNVSSDRRLKKEIAPLHASDLLKRLMPARYRLISDDKKLHFGLIAQDVQTAVAGTDYEDAALIGSANPDSLGLCYEELIAVLVEGWQAHDKQIAELKRRLERLEETTC